MTRGYIGWAAVCCLAFSGGACALRKETSEQKKASEQQGASEQQPAPGRQTVPPEQKEDPPMATTLDCALSVPPSVRAGEPVELRFQLTNRTTRPLYVLTWRTPLEGLLGNDFLVTRDGAEIPYQGRMVKRGNPQAENYVTLTPGASVDAKIELSLAYEMNQPGRYRIEFRGPLMDVAQKQAEVPRSLEQLQPLPVRCPVVETTIG